MVEQRSLADWMVNPDHRDLGMEIRIWIVEICTWIMDVWRWRSWRSQSKSQRSRETPLVWAIPGFHRRDQEYYAVYCLSACPEVPPTCIQRDSLSQERVA